MANGELKKFTVTTATFDIFGTMQYVPFTVGLVQYNFLSSDIRIKMNASEIALEVGSAGLGMVCVCQCNNPRNAMIPSRALSP